MPVEKISGQAGEVLIAAATPTMTTWTITVSSDLQNTTGSDTFDPATNTLWLSKAKGPRSAEGSIEGKIDIDPTGGTSAVVAAQMMDNDPVMIVFRLTRDVDYGYGLFHMSEVEISIEVEGEATYSASVESTGIFTLGSPPAPGP